jgi:hypothetical protein
MATARTHCPECNSRAVIDLAEALPHPEVDFFWCGGCRSMWHLRKGENWPPSKALLEPTDSGQEPNLSSRGPTARPPRAPRTPGVRSHHSTRTFAASQR